MYTIVKRVEDRFGNKWTIDGKIYEPFTDRSLSYVLNQYGAEGWELVTKEDGNTYIFKKLHQDDE
jgi:hypothetical protein